MVGPGARAFLAADCHHAGIKQIAKEFPPRGRFISGHAQGGSDAVGRRARRHRSGNPGQPPGIARGKVGIGGEHRQAVRRRDKPAPPDDQVAIAVAIRRRAKIGRIRAKHRVEQRLGMDHVGIGMVPAEIFERHTVFDRARGKTKPVFKNFRAIWASHRVHRIECHRQARRADRGKIEQRFHQVGIVGDRVDHADHHAADMCVTHDVQIDIGGIDSQPTVDRQRARVDRLGHAFGRGAAIGDVVFDPEIFVGATGVVAGRQDQPAACAIFADHVAGGGR